MLSPDAGRAASARLWRVGWFLQAHIVETKLRALEYAVKASFDPNQPRVPAGNPDGGQWRESAAAAITRQLWETHRRRAPIS